MVKLETKGGQVHYLTAYWFEEFCYSDSITFMVFSENESLPSEISMYDIVKIHD